MQAPERDTRSVPARTITVVIAAALVGVAAGGWLVWSALNPRQASVPNRAEIVALRTRLGEVQSAITPVAVSFTAETTSGVIDIADYRVRIAVIRNLVDETNGMSASSPEALEIRDLIVTGGSQVLDGLDDALDALASDDESATVAPDALVGDGIAALQEAQVRIDEVLETPGTR